MHKNNKYFSVVVLMAASQVHAATPLYLQSLTWSAVQAAFPLQRHSTVAPAFQALQVEKQRTDEKGTTHVHLQQVYQGFMVFGGYAIAHGKGLSSTARMSGVLYQDLQTDLGSPLPSLKQGAATALQQFTAKLPTQLIYATTVLPMVYIDEQSKAHWAYQVSAMVSSSAQMPKKPTAILDAKTLKPLLQWDDIKTMRSLVKGQGYGGNPVMGKYQYGLDRPLLTLSRDDFSGRCYLENQRVRVVNMAHEYQAINRPVVFDCEEDAEAYWTGEEQDGYDRANGAYSPSNDALYVGEMIDAMYQQWYGVNALGGLKKPMVMRVHYGQQYENAFWDGFGMTFGDGGFSMYPLVSLGIGAHEIGHGFTEQHANLIYVGQAGGMNESFSDMASQAVEYFTSGSNHWEIGAEVMKQHGDHHALRYMDHPSKDGHSIERASQYRSGLDVHLSSGVYNRLFYVLAHQPNWDTRKAFHVMLKANMDYWTPYSTFTQGGCGILDAARDLEYPKEDVLQALMAVEIDGEECER